MKVSEDLISVTHAVSGKISQLFFVSLFIKKIPKTFGSNQSILFTSSCFSNFSTISTAIIWMFFCFLISQLYMISHNSGIVLSVSITPFDMDRFQILSKTEKNIHLMSVALYIFKISDLIFSNMIERRKGKKGGNEEKI